MDNQLGKRNVLAALFVVLIAVGATMYSSGLLNRPADKEILFSEELSLKELAMKNGVPPGQFKHVMSHELEGGSQIPMGKPVKALGVDEAVVRDALEHCLESGSDVMVVVKFGLWAVLLSIVVLWVLTLKKITAVRAGLLVFSVVLFGFVMGFSPNPMEALVKLFKLTRGMQGGALAVITGFVLFSLFSIWGAKLICSWGCHLGALQESIYNVPLLKKFRWKVPFWLSIGVRLAVFGAFIVFLFGIGTEVKNFVIYHHVNYFKLFRFPQLAKIALYTLPVMLTASFFVFRPFCQFVCPFGLWAWLLENVAVNRIGVNRESCIDCGKCDRACPTESMNAILKGSRFLKSDCWSCGRCIEACPTDAVEYGVCKSCAAETGREADSE